MIRAAVDKSVRRCVTAGSWRPRARSAAGRAPFAIRYGVAEGPAVARFSAARPPARRDDATRRGSVLPRSAVDRSGGDGGGGGGRFVWVTPREAKILVALAAATAVGTVAWQWQSRRAPPDVVRAAERGAEARVAGRPDEAKRHYETARSSLKQSHASDPWHLFTTTFAAADLALEQGKFKEAGTKFDECLTLCATMESTFSSRRLHKLGIETKHAITLDRLAQVEQELGNVDKALSLYRAAGTMLQEQLAEKSNHHDASKRTAIVELAGAKNNEARLLTALEKFDEAESVAKAVVNLCRGATSVVLASAFRKVEAGVKKRTAERRNRSQVEGSTDPDMRNVEEDAPVERPKKKKPKNSRRRFQVGDQSLDNVARDLLHDVRQARRESRERRRLHREQRDVEASTSRDKASCDAP